MNILLATDAFPPRCGGSGWSTYHLARSLRARGHQIAIVRPALNRVRPAAYRYDGFHVVQVGTLAPPAPVLRNVAKNEVFWSRGAKALARYARAVNADVIHGQHVMTIPAAVGAGRLTNLPVVATIRDYWPTCPIGTRLRPDGVCMACSVRRLTDCLADHQPARAGLVRVLQGYVEANRGRRQAALRAADRVIAVSRYVADDLRDHAGVVAQVVPNMVELPAMTPPAPPELATLAGPPVVFVGKLDTHKGADRLAAIVAAADGGVTLVAIGDGPLRRRLIDDCRDRGVSLLHYASLPNAAVLAWLAHARVLVSPARWPEPLSRVWLEACSVRCPIVATPVGGAHDAIIDGVTGFLAADDVNLSLRLRQIIDDSTLRERLAEAAGSLARTRFSAAVVTSQMEAIYHAVIDDRG